MAEVTTKEMVKDNCGGKLWKMQKQMKGRLLNGRISDKILVRLNTFRVEYVVGQKDKKKSCLEKEKRRFFMCDSKLNKEI